MLTIWFQTSFMWKVLFATEIHIKLKCLSANTFVTNWISLGMSYSSMLCRSCVLYLWGLNLEFLINYRPVLRIVLHFMSSCVVIACWVSESTFRLSWLLTHPVLSTVVTVSLQNSFFYAVMSSQIVVLLALEGRHVCNHQDTFCWCCPIIGYQNYWQGVSKKG